MKKNELSEIRTKIYVGNYVNNYEESGITISNFCKEKKLSISTFKRILKEEYPDFFQKYYSSDRRKQREKEAMEKRLLFSGLLETMDPSEHKLDSIDYYEITKEAIKPIKSGYSFCGKGYINKSLSVFFQKNVMEPVLTQREILENRSYGYLVNGVKRDATKEEKLAIYNDLQERKIPICDRTISDQYRRNLGLNTDWHYKKEKKSEKVIKKSEKETKKSEKE